ncbi:MAG: TIGR00266 family protein [Candidatus Promineifilaceae bacterium]|nr:TIGR00266 family protein [Candidatus Promineifilaceae bacterium]
MQIDIHYRPAYALGEITLDPNEAVRVEGGSMVSMSAGVTLETAATGGFLKSLGRALLGGESFFQNTFQAPPQGGQLMVAPALPGDLFSLELTEDSLLVQSGAYVASELALDVSTKWGGSRTFFASEGLIMLRVAGSGTLLLSSYGAIHALELEEGQRYTVDTGHLVAFSENMGFEVRRIGGMKSTLFSGEGLVVDLKGPGRVLMQTRSADAFLAWLIPQLPQQSSGTQ